MTTVESMMIFSNHSRGDVPVLIEKPENEVLVVDEPIISTTSKLEVIYGEYDDYSTNESSSGNNFEIRFEELN